MQGFTVFIICCSLLFVTHGQHPRPCAAPPLFEGRLVTIDPSKHFEFIAAFSYDAFEERERLVGEVITGPNQTIIVGTILLYKQHALYNIFYHNKTCSKSPLSAPFRRVEVPHDAHFNGQFVIGSSSAPGEGLLANSWSGEVKEQGARYHLTTTEIGCLPINVLYHTNETGWIVTSYYDIIDGIKDPNVFVPPEFCK
ncbi:ependymin-like [Protopterus annectens]|uniref:ependymin-like n=1 Tax=Protopterus annectens TaxID=7888 RepID=UPI001CF9FD37|nr:ependymin-like [Protopterus annectens]